MAIDSDGHLENRTEEVFINEKYKVFLLTGQLKEGGSGDRAYVSVLPFHKIESESVSTAFNMRAKAKSMDQGSGLALSTNGLNLIIDDEYTGKRSTFPLSELAPTVRDSLLKPASPQVIDPGLSWGRR
jgi:hypothetical protein